MFAIKENEYVKYRYTRENVTFSVKNLLCYSNLRLDYIFGLVVHL